jgi:hypothetical protein
MLSENHKRWWHLPLALITKKYDDLSSFGHTARWLVVLLLLSVLGLVAMRFEFGRVRGAGYFIDKARLAITRQDWDEARGAMEQVQAGEKNNPVFLRVVANYLIGTRSSPALLIDTLKNLETAGKAEPEDALWMSMACHATGNIRQARTAWEHLPVSVRGGKQAQEIEIDLLMAEGRTQEAAEAEKRLLDRFPNDPEIAMRLAARRQQAPFAELQKEATKELLELATRADITGLQSIQILVRRSGLTQEDAEHLLKHARKHEKIVMEDRLSIVSMVMRQSPERREALLQEEIAAHQGKGAAIRARLASWLVKEREFAKFDSLVADESLLHPGDLYPLKAQVLVAQERWQDLLNLVGKYERLRLSPARAAVWRALATRHLKPESSEEIRAHLEDGLRLGSTENNVLALQGVSALAEEWRLFDLALAAHLQLARQGTPGEAAMLEKCWELAVTLKDSATLSAISKRQHALRPEDPLAIRRHDYLRLLRGEEVESTLMHGAQTPEFRQSASYRLLAALKAYRLRDWHLTAALLSGIDDITDLNTGEKAVFAGLLASLPGETSRSFQIAEKIHPQLLLHEEQVFWKKAL